MRSVMLLLASRSLSTFIIDKVSLGGSLSPGMLKLCNSCCAEFACHLIPCLRSEMLPNQLDPREHLLSWCLLFGLLFVAGSQTTYTTTDTLSLRTRFNMPVGYLIFASWRMAAELSTALLHAFHHALVPLVMWLLFEFGCGMPLMGLASMNDFLHVIMHAAYYLATGLLWHEPRLGSCAASDGSLATAQARLLRLVKRQSGYRPSSAPVPPQTAVWPLPKLGSWALSNCSLANAQARLMVFLELQSGHSPSSAPGLPQGSTGRSVRCGTP